MRLQLKRDIVERVEQKGKLVGEIADVLDRHYLSMNQVFKRNDPQLTQKAVLTLISKALDIPENELLEEVNEIVSAVK